MPYSLIFAIRIGLLISSIFAAFDLFPPVSLRAFSIRSCSRLFVAFLMDKVSPGSIAERLLLPAVMEGGNSAGLISFPFERIIALSITFSSSLIFHKQGHGF
jgi:hypothetical protein